MQHEIACNRICDSITSLLLELRPRTSGSTYAAACATRDIADALHHAAGFPEDARWPVALTSLELFLGYCDASPKTRDSEAFLELRRFLEENSDLAYPNVAHQLAS
jgi:hypothetical protein